MGVYVNDNGVLRNIVAIYTNDNGVLRQIVSIYANDNGVLREIPITPVQLEDATYNDNFVVPGTGSISIRFLNSGEVQTAAAPAGFGTQYNWLLAGDAGDYELRVTVDSGTLTSGDVNVWHDMSGGAGTYVKESTSLGAVDVDLTVEIRRASDAEVLATAAITLRVTGL